MYLSLSKSEEEIFEGQKSELTIQHIVSIILNILYLSLSKSKEETFEGQRSELTIQHIENDNEHQDNIYNTLGISTIQQPESAAASTSKQTNCNCLV